MKGLNRVFLLGHLGNTPELQVSKGGKPFARLSVATNRVWKTARDEKQESTEWHSVFVWGPMAETCCEWLRKGAMVFVEGSLSYWQVAQQGEYKNAIQALNVHFLSVPKGTLRPPQMENREELDDEILDIQASSINHNAVAHPA